MSTIGYTTTDALEARLEALLSTTLSATEKAVAAQALQDAYDEILTHLEARGVSLASITAWRLGLRFQLDIGVYFVLDRLRKLDPEERDRFNLISQLDNVAIVTSTDAVADSDGVAVMVDLTEINDRLGICE